MLHNSLLIFCLLISLIIRGNSINATTQDIKKDNTELEQKILELENIILDPESSHSDLYRAYLHKYDIYKSVFDYTQAFNNLDLALKEGLLTQDKDKIRIQIKIERLFVYFDLLDFDKVNEMVPTISKTDLNLLDEKTQGFYYSVLGVLEIRKKNYDMANTYLNEALVILEKSAPEHLPLIYRKKLGMYREQGIHDKVIESFEKGLYYAEKYHTDIYIIAMYDDIALYYAEVGDYKNAHIAEAKVLNVSTKFNGHNRSSKLQILEKNLLEKRKELEVENEKRNRNYLIILAGVLIIVLLLLFYFFKSAKQKRIIAELEANNMRNELKRITKELTESGQNKIDLETYNLTERQLQIIDLVKQGKSNKEIGETLFISVNTVKYHLKIIYDLLGIKYRTEL